MLTVDGNHVPDIALSEVNGSRGAVSPEQSDEASVNVGVALVDTVIVVVVAVAQAPEIGVKVYDPVVVLLTVGGVHVPVTALSEVVAKIGATVPVQIVFEIEKVGVTGADTTLIVLLTGNTH